jgi:hypothetical protein
VIVDDLHLEISHFEYFSNNDLLCELIEEGIDYSGIIDSFAKNTFFVQFNDLSYLEGNRAGDTFLWF